MEAVRAQLSSACATCPDGIPAGVILLPRRSIGPFREAVQAEIGKLRFKEVVFLHDWCIIHLPAEAAAFFDVVDDTSARILQEASADYYPGIRRQDPLFGFHRFSTHRSCRFRFAEVFAGIGGFRLGLEPLGGECVFASEIDPHAKATYAANFGNADMIGDITDFPMQSMPEIDLLTAGFPCQSFSQRGEQKGLDDSRGQLFRELVRILKRCQPKCFLFENVAALVTFHGGYRNKRNEPMSSTIIGQTMRVLLHAFESAGYIVNWQIINARHWLPQQRERVYFVGFREDMKMAASAFNWQRVIASAQGLSSCVWDILESTLPRPGQHQSFNLGSYELTPVQWQLVQQREKQAQEGSSTWPNKTHNIVLKEKAPTLISSYHSLSSFTTKFVYSEGDSTLRDDSQSESSRSGRPRFLTERECARLMGFPESFVLPTQPPAYRDEVFVPRCLLPLTISTDCQTQEELNSGSNLSHSEKTESSDYQVNNNSVQGFDKGIHFTSHAKSNTAPKSSVRDDAQGLNRLYHQLGNAVCPPVIKSIAEQMLWALESPSTGRC
jgi:DNA (cytosine-5)-methyltransferase 1